MNKPKDYPDCGDNGCAYCPPEHRGGMRTNGGCRCINKVDLRQARHDAAIVAQYWMRRALAAEEKIRNDE